MKWAKYIFLMIILTGCSRPPDLEAPCHQFGKYCPQYPINDEPIREISK